MAQTEKKRQHCQIADCDRKEVQNDKLRISTQLVNHGDQKNCEKIEKENVENRIIAKGKQKKKKPP
jgi:hypothetical protein